MSPPRKNNGDNTNESVVEATRAPLIFNRAPSSSGSSDELRKALRKTPSMNVWVALPPAPCDIVMRYPRGSHRADVAGPGAAGVTASPAGASATARRALRLLTRARMTASPSAPAGERVTMAGSW
jgi:hypothetical protein